MQLKKLSFLIPVLFLLSSSRADIKIETFIQPMYSFEEKGSWDKDGDSEFSIHRAKLSVKLTKKYKPLSISSNLEMDLSERNFENMLKNAYIILKFFPALKAKFGRFKIPFGANSITGSSDLWTVHRSYTTDHIRDELKVGGFQNGAILYGSFLKFFSYSIGAFNYEENRIEGTHIKDILDFPVAKISFDPLKKISINYMFTAPQAGVSMPRGSIKAMRLFLHDFSIELALKKWYECFFEAFIGIDTSDFKEAYEYLKPDYKENLAYSLYTLHSFIISLTKRTDIRLTNGFEYLNGLNCFGGKNENRSYYFSLLQAIRISIGKKLSLELSYDNRYDDDFKSTGYRRISGQITFKNSVKIDNGKKKKGEK